MFVSRSAIDGLKASAELRWVSERTRRYFSVDVEFLDLWLYVDLPVTHREMRCQSVDSGRHVEATDRATKSR